MTTFPVLLLGLATLIDAGCTFNKTLTTMPAVTNDVIAGYGGWGPSLRSVMKSSKGDLYFGTNVVDATTKLNTQAVLWRSVNGSGAWQHFATVQHAAGSINQKDAFIMNNDIIFSYSVNWGASTIEECYFVLQTMQSACNYLTLSGQMLTIEASSNYVGALSWSGASRVVWWTTVGQAGAAGKWTYVANYGGGWNGAFVVPLTNHSWTDFAYVAAMSQSSVYLTGQAIVGNYVDCNNACYRVGVGAIDLTKGVDGVSFVQLGAPTDSLTVGDIYASHFNAVHVTTINVITGKVDYYFKPSRESWDDNNNRLKPRATIPGLNRMRFQTDGTLLCLSGIAATGVKVYCWPLDSQDDALSFGGDVCTGDLVLPSAFAPPSGIYVESRNYQTFSPNALQFVVSGDAAKSADSQLAHVKFQVTFFESTTTMTTTAAPTPMTTTMTTTSSTKSTMTVAATSTAAMTSITTATTVATSMATSRLETTATKTTLSSASPSLSSSSSSLSTASSAVALQLTPLALLLALPQLI